MSSGWTGERVRLRAIEPDEWPFFMSFDSEAVDARSANLLDPPRSTEAYRRWASEQAAQVPDGDTFRLGIEARSEQTLVGTINTVDACLRAGRFSYGVAVGWEHRRRGYASEAIRLLLTYMFGERRYHKCEVWIYAFNDASLTLHRKLGFTDEGRLRDHEFFAGSYHDTILVGLTFDEFEARHGLSQL